VGQEIRNIFSLIAVAACVIVVVARYVVSVLIQRMNLQAMDAEKGLRKVKLDLKAAENKQRVAELELKKYDEELEK
jgi:hypothetical protein